MNGALIQGAMPRGVSMTMEGSVDVATVRAPQGDHLQYPMCQSGSLRYEYNAAKA